jgi:two-component system response regulator
MNNKYNAIRTLIVDDSEDDCLLLQLELRHVATIKLIGFAHDGLEALAYLSGTDRFKDREMFPYPDLMLLDFRMPGCDGIELLTRLHRHFHRPRVVLWSDNVEQIDISMALRLGADLVCRKAANAVELVEIIGRAEKVFNKPRVREDGQISDALMAT